MVDDHLVHLLSIHLADPRQKTMCWADALYHRVSRDPQFRDVTCLNCLDETEKLLTSQLANVLAAKSALQVAS